jgi:two-component system, NarL family, response regulator DevR
MKDKQVKLLLVDDHAIVRCGIRMLLEKNPEFVVCGESENLSDAYEKVKELSPDIVLLDIKLPDGDGAAGCGEIKRISPSTKVIILTAYADDAIVLDTIKAGADGYLLKNIDSKAIVNAVKNVSQGIPILDPTMVGGVFKMLKDNNDMADKLTSQEKNIMDLICLGKTNKEVADVLFIAEKTVRNNVSKIMRKLNVTNRTEAAILWSRQKSLK